MKTDDPNTRRDGEEPSAPPALVAALKELPARRVFVPSTLDAAVLAAARRHLEPRPARRGWIAQWRSWPAFAGAALLLIALLLWLGRTGGERFAREDLNQDGRVDILDAFQLARELRSAAKPVDVNGDGVVDDRDARWI